jgi:hypothetical protein
VHVFLSESLDRAVVKKLSLPCSDLDLVDWQHIRQELSARAFVAAPMVVAQQALGAVTIASTQPHAFEG